MHLVLPCKVSICFGHRGDTISKYLLLQCSTMPSERTMFTWVVFMVPLAPDTNAMQREQPVSTLFFTSLCATCNVALHTM